MEKLFPAYFFTHFLNSLENITVRHPHELYNVLKGVPRDEPGFLGVQHEPEEVRVVLDLAAAH